MQSVPESRTQTFEEIYGPPENFLEIEVSYIQCCFSIIPREAGFLWVVLCTLACIAKAYPSPSIAPASYERYTASDFSDSRDI